jgi:hypothetical protein
LVAEFVVDRSADAAPAKTTARAPAANAASTFTPTVMSYPSQEATLLGRPEGIPFMWVGMVNGPDQDRQLPKPAAGRIYTQEPLS